MVGALLVQRTTWRNATAAIERLRDGRYLEPERLAQIDTGELSELIRVAGFFRVKAARLKALADFVVSAGGISALHKQPTERLREQLLALQGVGPETADAILGYAFGRPVLVVDAYTRRLFARLHHPSGAPTDAALKTKAESTLVTTQALNEFHALVIAHGQRCCLPKPKCAPCSLRQLCGSEQARRST